MHWLLTDFFVPYATDQISVLSKTFSYVRNSWSRQLFICILGWWICFTQRKSFPNSLNLLNAKIILLVGVALQWMPWFIERYFFLIRNMKCLSIFPRWGLLINYTIRSLLQYSRRLGRCTFLPSSDYRRWDFKPNSLSSSRG